MNSDTKTKAQPQDSEETEAETDKARFEKDYIDWRQALCCAQREGMPSIA